MYQVKKAKSRRASLRSARQPAQVDSSIPGRVLHRCQRPRGEHESFGEWLGPEFRLLDRYELQDALVDTLKRTDKFSHLASRVAECHRSFGHWVCENRHEWAQAKERCNVRLCPHCQRLRSLRLAARWEKVLIDRDDLRYIVFAERNSADLSEGHASLYRAWARLRKHPLWKKYVRGAIAALEITYNATDQTWHPHLNVMVSGSYIPFEALNQAWIAATHGNGRTSHIGKVNAGTIRELLKYVTKLSDFVAQPQAVEIFLRVVARKRFLRTYGEFYNLPIEEDETQGHCPDCGSDHVVYLGPAHANQVVFDYNGVLRIDRRAMRQSQRDARSDHEIAWPRAPVERALCDVKWIAMVKQIEGRERSETRV